MRQASLVILVAAMALGFGAAFADPLNDAKAGLDALNRGDNDMAIRLFSSALNSGGLSTPDRELAYVKRAQAYVAEKNTALALSDLDQAETLDSTDPDIKTLRKKIQQGGNGPSLSETISYLMTNIPTTISYTIYSHDSLDPSVNYTDVYKFDFGTKCMIGLKRTETYVVNDEFHSYESPQSAIFFSSLRDITVHPLDEVESKRRQPQGGIIVSTSPEIWLIVMAKSSIDLEFDDEGTANRVAKALAHAAELCGGGVGSDPFE